MVQISSTMEQFINPVWMFIILAAANGIFTFFYLRQKNKGGKPK